MTMIPASVEHEAVDLVRALCETAGDEARVVDLLRRLDPDLDSLRRLCTAALIVTYSRCLPGPVSDSSAHTKEQQ